MTAKSTSWRGMALALTAVTALFTASVIGGLLAIAARQARTEVINQTRLDGLKAQLAKSPDDPALIETIRREDLALRARYVRDEARLAAGAYLLLAGALALVLSAKWLATYRPRGPRPVRRAEASHLGRADRPALTRRSLAGVAAVFALVAAGLGGTVLWPFDPLPPPTGGRTVSGAAGTQPTATAVAAVPVFKENWPRFRGADGLGLVPAGDWPSDWNGPAGKNVLWKCPIPAEGKGSPVIWGNRIFLSSANVERKQLSLTCVDRAAGRVLWTRTFAPDWGGWTEQQREDFHVTEDTGWAAATPATDGRYVCAAYATADIVCYDMDGQRLWGKNLGAPSSNYGLAASLLIYKDTVIWQVDQGGDPEGNLSNLWAFDLKSGADIWSAPRPVKESWTTPILAKVGKDLQIITSANPWVIAYDPDAGLELWRANGVEGDVAPSPVCVDGVVYVTNDASRLAAIRADGVGDVTETHTLWTGDEGMPDIASPLCDGKRFLQAKSSGRVTCFAAADGKLLWDHDFPNGFKASPTLVGNLVYLTDENGKTYLFELADAFAQRGLCVLGEAVDATPAFADGRIYFRGHRNLYCIGKSAK
jgi:outer membrane protein assembly factor BamB